MERRRASSRRRVGALFFSTLETTETLAHAAALVLFGAWISRPSLRAALR